MRTLVWLQRELRTQDHPALEAALSLIGEVIVAYFHDPEQTIGDANSAWLAHSLMQLENDFKAKDGTVWFIEGEFESNLACICKTYQIDQVYYTAQVGEPFTHMQQQAANVCQDAGVRLKPFCTENWFDYNDISTQNNTPYKVFTPFFNSLVDRFPTIETFDKPALNLEKTAWLIRPKKYSNLPKHLSELIKQPWSKKIMANWQVGEKAAWDKAECFVESHIDDYPHDHDYPALEGTSRLSAHLHFGEIHSRALLIWLMHVQHCEGHHEGLQAWIRQLAWREFARYVLWHFPHTQHQPFQAKFKGFYQPLSEQNHAHQLDYQDWCEGKTGVPIIDAGMRQLWSTGWMHNRVRMLTASWLTKNHDIAWLEGKRWFDNTLVDADPANNVLGWQWVAGCGVDAAPFYRLFNPVRQSEKYDPEGEYLREWVPELKHMPNKMIHKPWQFDEDTARYDLKLDEDYPLNDLDFQESNHRHKMKVEELKKRSS